MFDMGANSMCQRHTAYDERSALESLGLLAKTGDNIIVSLINANVQREALNQRRLSQASEEIASSDALAQLLSEFYGENIFGRAFDFSKNADALFNALKHLEIIYPKDVFAILSPSHVLQVKKDDLPAFKRFCDKNQHQKPSVAKDTCDLLLMALISKYGAEVAKQQHFGKGPKPRHISFALRWEAFVSSRV